MGKSEQTSSRFGFLSRLLMGIALLPLAMLIAFHEVVAALIGFGVGAMMNYEVIQTAKFRVMSRRGLAMMAAVIVPSAYAVLAHYLGYDSAPIPSDILVALAIILAVLLPINRPQTFLVISIMACIYSFMGLLMLEGGHIWLVLAIITVISTDSCAYFGGKLFGGAKFMPSISPSKTWSGTICGIASGILIASMMGHYAFGLKIGVVMMMQFGSVSIVAVLGDLLESWFKRQHNIKDSGSVFLAHGGFLDRFDGYLLSLPFVFLLLRFGYLDG